MKITSLEIEEVKLIEYDNKTDNRGFSYDTYREDKLEELNFQIKFERIYHIEKKHTIFGIHFQNNPHAQNKIIEVLNGKGISYAIDLRKTSKTYLKYVSATLDSNNHYQLFIPKGFGHLFLSLEDMTINVIRCDDYFNKECGRSIKYNDPLINIDFSDINPILSDKDKLAKLVYEVDNNL